MAEASENSCGKGFAFVVEGSTERVFYQEYLQWCCNLTAGASMTQLSNKDIVISTPDGNALIKFNVKGSVGSIPNAMNWVRSTCRDCSDMTWTVVLCYDTDGDTALSLNTRAWKRFRQDLAQMKLPVIDLAADADIEDIMLVDIDGVHRYLGLQNDVKPRGKKGKAKLNSLFKAVDVTQPYHEGERARPLVRSLSFDTIENNAPIGIEAIRQAVFGSRQQ